MTNGEPAGLMAFWADIDSGYEPRFLEWHNCEHMPERVSVPGFREGRRYCDLGGLPRYLMMYFTESAGVLGSDAYTERLNHPTPWTRESLGHFRNPSRNVYSVLAEHGRTSLREFPYLISVRFDIETAERGIYEGGPGSQCFLLLAECACPGVAETEEWRAAWACLDASQTGDGAAIVHAIREAFRIDYVLPAA